MLVLQCQVPHLLLHYQLPMASPRTTAMQLMPPVPVGMQRPPTQQRDPTDPPMQLFLSPYLIRRQPEVPHQKCLLSGRTSIKAASQVAFQHRALRLAGKPPPEWESGFAHVDHQVYVTHGTGTSLGSLLWLPSMPQP